MNSRPEYPRPQFVRRDWLNLNGEWEFASDTDDIGLREGWSDGRRLERRISVPYAYQTRLSKIDDKGIYPVVWYARDFAVPADWEGRDILLRFGAVDYRATVWVNGAEVARNQGGHVPFACDITPYLTEGGNRLTVRVEDSQDPDQPRGKQAHSGIPEGCDYYCTTGIWQTVWLEPAPTRRIDDIRVTAILKGQEGRDEDTFEVCAYLHAPAGEWDLRIEVMDAEGVVAAARQRVHGAAPRVFLPIPDAVRWSPETPHLYDLRLCLERDGEILDEVRSYAGMRSAEVRGGEFLLNGEPLYLKMVLDQGYWPDGGMTAPSDEALRADVEWVKRFGFNGVRKHQKVEDPRWLYWCDRLGLLVWGEMANARTWSPHAEEMLLSEWERAVRRDYNHPCIVAWVPVNESWGAPDLGADHPGQYAYLERIVALTRRLDPYRLVIDNDGWEHTDVSDIMALHDYTPTSADLLRRYAHTLEGGPLPEMTWQRTPYRHFVRDSRHQGQPVMLTEVGGFLLAPPGPEEEWDALYQAYGWCRSEDELLAKYEDLMSGIAALTFVSGFCYTQLADIEQETNGLLTYDRRPKIAPEAVREIHDRCFEAFSHRRSPHGRKI